VISAVVLTWNSAQYIEKCLRSLVADACEVRTEMEIFVVDGGSTDGTLGILSQLVTEISSLHTIQLGKNLGTTASRVGGFAEIIEDERHGFLVEPGDAKSLAQALMRILADDELRVRMAGAVQRLANEELSWDTIAKQTIRLYKMILG